MVDEIENIEDLSFEEALSRLEGIVRELESGRIKLDDAVKAYENAVKLKKLCTDKLNAAALKVEKIEISKDGSLSTSLLDNVEE
jgi:exodeoxyribonuclease VII small subunit